MLILASTSDLIKVITGGAQAIDVHASYLDFNGTAVTPGNPRCSDAGGDR